VSARSTARAAALAAGVFALAFTAAGWAAGTFDPPRMRRVAVRPPTPAQYDSATVMIRGSLSAPARERIAAASGARRVALLVVRGPDSGKCEDLGRQLRELQRSAPELPLLIATDSASVEQVTTFARRERLRVRAVLPVAPSAVVEGRVSLPSPTVLLVPAAGGDVAGVGHPLRFSNTRVRSFAAELQPLL
jgi:hypothetical protein